VIEAHGHVVSELADKSKSDTKAGDTNAPAKSAAPGYTKVSAKDLVYTEDTKLAFYQGGVSLIRPDLTVDSKELRAFLKDSDSNSDSSLDKALADGAVKIVSNHLKVGSARRIRTSTGEHSEYYADEGKVIIQGGEPGPKMVDSLKGETEGSKLTWWEKDDRLLNNGDEVTPAKSTLRKVKK
jgi:hypothetical protein